MKDKAYNGSIISTIVDDGTATGVNKAYNGSIISTIVDKGCIASSFFKPITAQ